MSSPAIRLAVAGLSALAVVVGFAALPAEAKTPAFAKVFSVKLPGEPMPGSTIKAATKGVSGGGTSYAYNDAVGSLTLSGFGGKAGLTTTTILMSVNVFSGMDLTNVTFPVTRKALVTMSYAKSTINLSHPTKSKNKVYSYTGDTVTGVNVTVTSYDPVKNEMKGTLDGVVAFQENVGDPTDDARDGKLITLKGAKFALKPFGQ